MIFPIASVSKHPNLFKSRNKLNYRTSCITISTINSFPSLCKRKLKVKITVKLGGGTNHISAARDTIPSSPYCIRKWARIQHETTCACACAERCPMCIEESTRDTPYICQLDLFLLCPTSVLRDFVHACIRNYESPSTIAQTCVYVHDFLVCTWPCRD